MLYKSLRTHNRIMTLLATTVIMAIALAACGGGDEDAQAAVPQPIDVVSSRGRYCRWAGAVAYSPAKCACTGFICGRTINVFSPQEICVRVETEAKPVVR